MSYTPYATAVAGSILTAAFWNQQVRDNGLEVRAGGIAVTSQAVGDLLVAISPTQLDRVPTTTSGANVPLLGTPNGYPHWDGDMQLHGHQTIWTKPGMSDASLFLVNTADAAGAQSLRLLNYQQAFRIWRGEDNAALLTLNRNGDLTIPGALNSNGLTINTGGASVAGTLIVNNLTVNAGNISVTAGYIISSGPIYPGRIDVANGAQQSSFYLASHASYGLYSNTGLYLAGALAVVGPTTLSTLTNNGGFLQNGTLDMATNTLDRAKLRNYSEGPLNAATVPGNGYAYLDMSVGNHFYAAYDQSLTFAIRNPPAGVSMIVLAIIGQGTNFGTGWYGTEGRGGGVRWANGVPPAVQYATNKWDFYTLYTTDGGTTWWGFTSGQNM